LVTGIHISNNNWVQTVLEVFCEAVDRHELPSCVQGDHGAENILVAMTIEMECGVMWGSYIWGRCVNMSIPFFYSVT
jgi:hypothetical protein